MRTFVVAGLGNPGSSYESTRHNVGFRTIDELSQRLGIKVNKIKFKALIGEGRIGIDKVILVKPHTYMNNSGESIREVLNFYKIESKNLIVVVDDIDIDFATVRTKKKGSSGTHNGMKSIIYQIQSDDFPRIKIGIGKKLPQQDLADFVLSRFSKSEEVEIKKSIEVAADVAISIMEDGIDTAMNKYNKR